MKEYRQKHPERIKESKQKRRLLDQKRNKERHRENPVKTLILWSRKTAKNRGLEHTITYDDLVIPERCPVFKTEFVVGTPLAMSLDRIDNSKGYVPGNVQVISRLANSMKRDANQDQLKAFAEWILNG